MDSVKKSVVASVVLPALAIGIYWAGFPKVALASGCESGQCEGTEIGMPGYCFSIGACVVSSTCGDEPHRYCTGSQWVCGCS